MGANRQDRQISRRKTRKETTQVSQYCVVDLCLSFALFVFFRLSFSFLLFACQEYKSRAVLLSNNERRGKTTPTSLLQTHRKRQESDTKDIHEVTRQTLFLENKVVYQKRSRQEGSAAASFAQLMFCMCRKDNLYQSLSPSVFTGIPSAATMIMNS